MSEVSSKKAEDLKSKSESEVESKNLTSLADIGLVSLSGVKICSARELMLMQALADASVVKDGEKEEEKDKASQSAASNGVKGTVKFWQEDKGWGFVNSYGIEKDVFVHFKALKGSSKRLYRNDDVLFKWEMGNRGGPRATAVSRVSNFHLAYAKYFPLCTTPSDIPGTPLEIITHPNQEKRELAPFKARVKETKEEVGSLRKMGGNKLVLLFNRFKVHFTGFKEEKKGFEQWEDWFDLVENPMSESAIMHGMEWPLGVLGNGFGSKNKSPRPVTGKQLEKLKEFQERVLTFLRSRRSHARSFRISKLRELLPKSEFVPQRFGFAKFKDFLTNMKEIVLLNDNKIALAEQERKRIDMRKRKSESIEDKSEGTKKQKTELKE
mmetsp:Transcript_15856/g.23898  ORF Transcript_15856/g.23898 Transcript_15856/m.23898 type:complete len:381 (-) Transcript_15856:126-1268(-)|eukprot:CAMPEP_0167753756 /NCGR_PEP_ID=MMETSP0110_2-20121227/7891_1 /TAXON_ID=629695 /ORGANISM="Gymnochlora sp., Strain CCMP2014" /LENGTH=380 /DNA_ID=CAMNT_0007639559 /DNA_START=85 /DNA_END=1227 /DNA_ORIENTATION=+